MQPAFLGVVLGAFALVCTVLPRAEAVTAEPGTEDTRIALDLRTAPARTWQQRLLEDPVEVEIARRRRAIAAEIKSFDSAHPWAGHYYMGDGLGVNIELDVAPNAGAIVTWRGCLGRYGWNWGKITVEGDRLCIAFERPSDALGASGFAATYRIVAEGEKQQLEGREPKQVLERYAW